jgi:hypothetical protein
MKDSSLSELEHKVEAARMRLTADLERLRAPDTFATFKQESKALVTEQFRHVTDDLKSRAAANPLAAAAIGAGLIWHLSRHPPITPLLIGAGVFGLLRTDPRQPSAVDPWVSKAQQVGHTASEKLSDWSAAAAEAATQIGTASQAAKDTLQNWAEQASDTGRSAAAEVGAERDSILLAAAAAALAAALGIAYQRRGPN